MSETEQPSTNQTHTTIETVSPGKTDAIFAARPDERAEYPVMAWGVAALIAVFLAGAFIFLGHKHQAAAPSTLQPSDGYASSLPMTQFAMSEAANLSGGKLTYLDGHVSNAGNRIVTGVTVQAVFQNDVGMAPQIYTMPLTLIRMREPYIDTQPVGASPLKRGDDREFRLTFETVPDNWNTQMPEVRVIQTELQ